MLVRKYQTMFNQNVQIGSTKSKLCVITEEKCEEYTNYSSLSSPESVADLVNTLYNLCDLTEEYVYLLAVDTKNVPIGAFEVSHGTVDCSVVAPREIFMRALLCGAAKIVLAHNHPSGNVNPSSEDIKLTERIKQAGDIMGMPLLDHIIVGDNEFFSFKQENYM